MSWKKVLLEGDAAVLSDSTPEAITESASGSAGTDTEASRSDHVHASPTTWAPTAHLLGSHTTDTLANLNAKVTDATLDDSGDPRDPNAHNTSHQNGGGDEIDVTGLSGLLADGQTPLAHTLDSHSVPTGAVDFNKQEATTLVLQTATGAPGSPVDGQVYFEDGDDHPYVYVA